MRAGHSRRRGGPRGGSATPGGTVDHTAYWVGGLSSRVTRVACDHVLAQHSVVDAVTAASAHTDLAGTPHSAPLGRIFLREHLRGHVPPEVLQDAELLTTELISNVVMHARTSIHLGVTWDAHNVLVTVQDHDPAGPADRHQIGLEHPEESGRGMLLIASLADDFGWARLPDDVGKVMWFAMAIPPGIPNQAQVRQAVR